MKKIKAIGVLLNTSDIKKARHFYETVLGLQVLNDIGHMVEFEMFSLWSGYDKLVSGEGFTSQPQGTKIKMTPKPNNWQLYFEVKDFDYMVEKLKSTEGIELLSDITEYNWGQRSSRFYDYDGHIFELSESIHHVIKRFLTQGLTVEEVSKRLGFPVEYVQEHLNSDTEHTLVTE